jgi:hypothetical protein
LNTQLSEKLPQELPAEIAMAVLASSEFVNHGLPQEYFDTTIRIYTEALRLCWYVLTPMAGLGFFSSLLIKNHSMKQVGHPKSKPAENAENTVAVEVPTDAVVEDVKHDEKVPV